MPSSEFALPTRSSNHVATIFGGKLIPKAIRIRAMVANGSELVRCWRRW
jgi:hypothetical protein